MVSSGTFESASHPYGIYEPSLLTPPSTLHTVHTADAVCVDTNQHVILDTTYRGRGAINFDLEHVFEEGGECCAPCQPQPPIRFIDLTRGEMALIAKGESGAFGGMKMDRCEDTNTVILERVSNKNGTVPSKTSIPFATFGKVQKND